MFIHFEPSDVDVTALFKHLTCVHRRAPYFFEDSVAMPLTKVVFLQVFISVELDYSSFELIQISLSVKLVLSEGYMYF